MDLLCRDFNCRVIAEVGENVEEEGGDDGAGACSNRHVEAEPRTYFGLNGLMHVTRRLESSWICVS